MDTKFLRTLIYIFSGLIVVFSLLILVNYIGSLSGARTFRPGQDESASADQADGKLPNAESLAQQALAAAKFSGGGPGRSSLLQASTASLSAAEVNSQGGIMLVKEKDFKGVAEPPKGMLDVLNSLGGGDKRKPPPIALKESDLDKKIDVGGNSPAEPRLKASAMPEMGRGTGEEGVTLFTAPVDYKIFKSSETWWAFANSHKCRSAAETAAGPRPGAYSPLSAPEFVKESVLVLISVSELPNGIFKIIKFEKNGKELLVSYKVEPMAMSAGAERAEHDFYSAVVIPKAAAVKLSQVP